MFLLCWPADLSFYWVSQQFGGVLGDLPLGSGKKWIWKRNGGNQCTLFLSSLSPFLRTQCCWVNVRGSYWRVPLRGPFKREHTFHEGCIADSLRHWSFGIQSIIHAEKPSLGLSQACYWVQWGNGQVMPAQSWAPFTDCLCSGPTQWPSQDSLRAMLHWVSFCPSYHHSRSPFTGIRPAWWARGFPPYGCSLSF